MTSPPAPAPATTADSGTVDSGTVDSGTVDSGAADVGAAAPEVPGTAADGPEDSSADGAVTVPAHLSREVERVLLSEAQIRLRVAELAYQIDADYAGQELVLVGVLKGAVMVIADLARALRTPVSMEFMAVSSYGSGTSSSGVVRILKDLDRDVTGLHVLVVEDVVDSGLTLSWLLRNLSSRGPASLEVCALLRKPEAARSGAKVRYVGFDIGDDFVVGYGLDHAERHRDLPFVGLLTAAAQAGAGPAPEAPVATATAPEG